MRAQEQFLRGNSPLSCVETADFIIKSPSFQMCKRTLAQVAFQAVLAPSHALKQANLHTKRHSKPVLQWYCRSIVPASRMFQTGTEKET
jgi:hypothetical protein